MNYRIILAISFILLNINLSFLRIYSLPDYFQKHFSLGCANRPNLFFPTKTHFFPLTASYLNLVGSLLDTYFLVKNINYYGDNNEEDKNRLNKEQQELQKFVQEELKQNGIVNAEKIRLKYANIGSSAAALFNHTILIDEDSRENFIKAGILHAPLETFYTTDERGNTKIIEKWHDVDSNESEKLSNEICFILQHEAGHLKSNDLKKRIVTGFGISSLGYFSSLAITAKINSFIPSKKLQSLITAMGAVPLYVMNRLLFNAYCRNQEICADEQIPNKKKYLEGGITHFERKIEQKQSNIQLSKHFDLLYNKFTYLWQSTHPTDQWRLERLKERKALIGSSNT